MKRSIRTFLAGIGAATLALFAAPASADGIRENPLARFSDPVCPGVHGLSLEAAQAMVTRVRANLRDLGVQLAPSGFCEANLIIAFLEDGQAYLERVNDETAQLDHLNRSQLRDVLNQPGPVRSLIRFEDRGRDGQPVGYRENLVEIPQARMWSAHSRIYVPTRRDILHASVLIDRDEAEGMTIAQLADIATLYGLTDQLPEASRSTPSVKHIFVDNAVGAEELSDFDKAFLRRLYSLPPNLPASAYVEGLEGAATLRE